MDGKSLAAELSGASPVSESPQEKVQRKAKAVASLQKLFFEELRDSGDRNAAAAQALRRLVESEASEAAAAAERQTITCP